jgi:hypothetical protein
VGILPGGSQDGVQTFEVHWLGQMVIEARGVSAPAVFILTVAGYRGQNDSFTVRQATAPPASWEKLFNG